VSALAVTIAVHRLQFLHGVEFKYNPTPGVNHEEREGAETDSRDQRLRPNREPSTPRMICRPS
jgi:hypothetical protein